MMSCYPSIYKCFAVQDVCLYKLDKLDNLYPCRTGSHIKYCEDFECNQNYKCPGYYCVPWRYVCDGKWDCPHGHDEYSDSIQCTESQKCINMFKCRDSQICIHVYDVCNNYYDCPHKDDEVLCELRDTICPTWCQCLNFAVTCQLTQAGTDLFSSLPFVAYHIVSTGINSLSFLKKNTNIAILNVSKNSLNIVCGIVHEFCHLQSIDISSNNINEISPKCFVKLSHLHIVKIAKNDIVVLADKSFFDLGTILLIDLSYNKLKKISKSSFFNVHKIHMLNLFKNHLKNIESVMFNLVKISITLTSNFHICCVLPKGSLCLAKKPWYSSCTTSLLNTSMKTAISMLSLLIISLNLISIGRNVVFIRRKREGGKFSIIVVFINFGNSLCGMYLILLLLQNHYYQYGIILSLIQQKPNMLCLLTFMLILFSTLSEPYFFTLLSLARFMVVRYPFEYRFKSSSFVLRYTLYGSLFSVVITVSLILRFVSNQTTPSSLCSPFVGPSDSLPEIKIITFLVAIFQVVAFTFISALYLWLIKILKEIHEQSPVMSKIVNKGF